MLARTYNNILRSHSISCIVFVRHLANYNRSTISHTTAGADFFATTCSVSFPAGSGPGTVSTPSCDITINNDNIVEQNEIFSLSASITNSNGQDARFTAGGDTASATIVDDDRRWSC